MIDAEQLQNAKARGNKIVARCPACAEAGNDKAGNHLIIYKDGRFGCVAFAGDKAHRQRIAELVGDGGKSLPRLQSVPQPARRGKPALPRLEKPTVGELVRLQELRGFPLFAGLQLAANAGHLFFANMPDGEETVRVWVITDSARRNAQARRLDGRLWFDIDAKAKTLSGSEAAWPIGSADIGSKPTVALCEGGPDFLAAYFLAFWNERQNDIAPVAMLGAGHRINAEALPLFRAKQVLIFTHHDEAGQRARSVWAEQLRTAGAASVREFSCAPDKDINELIARCKNEMEDSQ